MVRTALISSPIHQRVGIVVLYLERPFRSTSLETSLETCFRDVLLFQGFDARANRIPMNWTRRYLPRFLYGRNLTPGEIACTFGHTEIIMSQNHSENDWIMICEDNLDFAGMQKVVDFLKGIQSESPVLINFLSNPNYDFVENWESINEVTIGKSESIPTLAKCYALNRKAIKSLCHGLQTFGFQGFEPDFPAFYKLCVDFYVLKHTPLRIAESQSLIGSRESLKIDNFLIQIFNAVLYILLPSDLKFWLRVKLINTSLKTKIKRRNSVRKRHSMD